VNRSFKPIEPWRERDDRRPRKNAAVWAQPAEQVPDETYSELRALFWLIAFWLGRR